MAQTEKQRKVFAFWHQQLCKANSAAVQNSAVQNSLVSLSIWMTKNELETLEHLKWAGCPSNWRGAAEYSKDELEFVTALLSGAGFVVGLLRFVSFFA